MRQIVLLVGLFAATLLSAPTEGRGLAAKQAQDFTHTKGSKSGQAAVSGLIAGLSQSHPRFLTDADGKESTWKLINEESWAAEVFSQLRKRTDTYVDRGADWLSSRLRYIRSACERALGTQGGRLALHRHGPLQRRHARENV